MSETLYLDVTNMGLWSKYRKQCLTKEEKEKDPCRLWYALLFRVEP
jgi:hypothetical protein